MLPDAERLRKAGLFQRVYTGRKSVSSDLFSLYVLPRQPKSSPRFPLSGFVVGKKTLSKACDRNRAKRRLREAYRAVKKELQLAGASDEISKIEQWYAIVWVIQAKVLKAEFSEIVKTVRQSLLKAHDKFGAKRASS